VRFYHYTNPGAADPQQIHQAAQSIARNGILIGKARGESYGEPNLVWASAQLPHHSKVFAEFSVAMDDPRWRVGEPNLVPQQHAKFTTAPGQHYNISPEEYYKRGSNVAFIDSILPHEIIAVHEPWHKHHRYIVSDPQLYQEAVNGELDHLLDTEYAPAIQKIKLDAH
jgi:hypothetical protein